jgi:eukaryotic-like serine/threonine-protein kinase
MDETLPPGVASEPSLAGLLDQVCDRFESACKSTTPPRLEDFLQDIPASSADRGFRELLELELAYRRRAGQTPSADEYRTRFPRHSATIDQVFRPPGLRLPATGPFDETISARMAGSFSDVVPADTQIAPGAAPARSVGTSTSSGLRFRVLRKHARGGLGEVFVAEDQELHREVALKQIQSQYADDTDSRSRFVLEAEVTGALEHPGIVPVYGLGTYADGRPFYAMRFIHGDSLKDAIDSYHDIDTGPRAPGERALELRKLLGRFVDVCDAIEFAHSRGIIHRDLKPGNIMLGNFGETLVVDWGLAKQIDRPESESKPDQPEPPSSSQPKPMLLSGTAATRMGSAVGTPQYMSPEQAAGRLDLIGPRSDVYSLGATLYCLLTGKAPLSDIRMLDLTEVLRRVQEGEIAPARAINAGVPKALEAICQKAMAVRPEGRYASARHLADDIEHWLADEPISAQPDTRTQLVARWIRRHRSLALATAIALLLISLVSTVATVLVNHQRKIADRLAIEKGDLAQKEMDARAQAELGFREARDAVDDLFTKVSEDTLLNQPGMQKVRKELLQKTLAYYQRFLAQRADDPTVQDELGIAFYRAGRITEEIESPEKALVYYEQAQKLQEKLLANSPGDRSRRGALGDTYNALGVALKQGRRLDEALRELQRAREIRQELVALAPHELSYGRALANSMMNVDLVNVALHPKDNAKTEEALRDLENAQQIRRSYLAYGGDTIKLQKDLALGEYNLGIQELRIAQSNLKNPELMKRHEEAARKHFADWSELLRQLIQQEPHDLTLQYQLASCYRWQGNIVDKLSPESVHFYQQARDTLARLVEHNPDVTEYKSALGGVYMNMADRQNGAESLASFEQARQILADLAKNDPENPHFDRDLAVTLQSLAERQSKAGQFEAARTNLEASLALLAQLNQRFPNYPDVVQKLAEASAALKQMNEQHPSAPRAPAVPEKPPPSPRP